jgi:hypothetical protein
MANKTIRTGILITGDASGAVRQIKLTEEELGRLNSAKEKSKNRAKDLSDQWGQSAKRALAWGAAISGVTAGAVTHLIMKAINAQDELGKMSQRVGVSVESLAGLDHAATLSGTSLGAVEKALKTVSAQMLDARRGLKASQENFDALGISILDSTGALKSADKVMIEVADQFAAMADGTEKTALATKLFGKSGLELIPMLNEGSAGLAALVAEGQRFNPVTSESAKQAEIFNDNLDRLKGSVSSLAVSIVNSMLPALAEFSETAINFVQSDEFGMWLDRLAIAAGALAIVLVSRALPGMAAYVAATSAATLESIRYQAVLARMAGLSTTAALAQTGLATATGALNSALMLVGGPVGALVLITAGLALMISRMETAKESTARLRSELDSLNREELEKGIRLQETYVRGIEFQIEKLERQGTAHVAARKKLAALNAELEEGQKALQELRRGMQGVEDREFDQLIDDMTEGAVLYVGAFARAATATGVLSDAVQTAREKAEDLISSLGAQQAQLYMTGKEQAIFANLQKAGADITDGQRARIIQLTNDLYDNQQQIASNAASAKAAAETIGKAAKDVADAQNKALADVEKASADAATKAAADWLLFRNSVSDSIADLVVSGGNLFDQLGKSFERMLAKMAGDLLASGVLSFLTGRGGFSLAGTLAGAGTSGAMTSALLTKFAPGLATSLGIGAAAAPAGALTSSAYLAMMQGGTGTVTATAGASGTGMLAGIKGALTSIPGWGWALAGAAALAMMFDKKSTPSHNAGFLLHDLPSVSADRKFSVDPFASGLSPVGFARRSTTAESQQVIDLFRAVDESIVNIAKSAGKTINAAGLRGFAETGLGSGIFFGAAGEDGRPGTAIDQQISMYAAQLIQSLRGQVADTDLDRILSAGGVDQMLGAMESVLATASEDLQKTSQDVAEVIDGLTDIVDIEQQLAETRMRHLENFQSGLTAARDYLADIATEQNRRIQDQMAAARTRYDDEMRQAVALHDMRYRLFQGLQSYTSGLRLGDMSGLTGGERLAFAQSQYQSLLAAARDTSLSMDERLKAAEEFSGAGDSLLRAFRDHNASAGYKGVFDQVLQDAESLKFLGTNKPFDGSAIENAMLQELEQLNDQVGALPDGIAQHMAGVMGHLINQGLLAGKTKEFVANTITGLGPGAVDAANQYLGSIGAGSVADYATSTDKIRRAVAEIQAIPGISEFDALSMMVGKAKELGLSAMSVGDALGISNAQVAGALSKFRIPMFADGGRHTGGWHVVGERGRELRYSGPATYFSNADTERMLAGAGAGNSADVVQELRQLRDVVGKLVSIQLQRADYDGRQMDEQTTQLRSINVNLKSRQGVGSGVYEQYVNAA